MKFFQTKNGKSHRMSPMEKLVASTLKKIGVRYLREVSFADLRSEKGGYLRFDFYLPKYNLILEYDGQIWHESKKVKSRDKKKDQFCKENRIRIRRLTKVDIKNMEWILKKLCRIK